MPKVTEEHRVARREQILDAAIRCAARDGFHRMTIAHVIAESGLSAGAVYGYFRGKSELIRAVADRIVGAFAGALEEVTAGAGPVTVLDGVRAVIGHIDAVAEASRGRVPKLAVHAWSEAARDDEIADVMRTEIATVHDAWRDLLARAERDGTIPPGLDHGAMARVLIGLMPGFVLQAKVLGITDAETYVAGAEGLLGLGGRS